MRDGLLTLTLIAVIFILFCTRPVGAGSSIGNMNSSHPYRGAISTNN